LGPRILFVDEPTAGIDPITQECIANVLNHFRTHDRLTVCMICNDVRTIRLMDCPVKILEEGKLFDLRDAGAFNEGPVAAIVEYFKECL
jgi:ABC-type transporter Mla maintaining outer membrane lipid asymmetry ATPase subunit MlaF